MTVLNGLPNNTKHIASRMVDLPEPFSPMIKVVGCLFNCISVNVLPVERKFFHFTDLNIIKFLSPVPPYKETSLYFSIDSYQGLHQVHQHIYSV